MMNWLASGQPLGHPFNMCTPSPIEGFASRSPWIFCGFFEVFNLATPLDFLISPLTYCRIFIFTPQDIWQVFIFTPPGYMTSFYIYLYPPRIWQVFIFTPQINIRWCGGWGVDKDMDIPLMPPWIYLCSPPLDLLLLYLLPSFIPLGNTCICIIWPRLMLLSAPLGNY